MIQRLDLTRPSPAENLALDEALLDLCDTGEGPQTLRFWEPADRFVVVGYANEVAREVEVERCDRDGVPILRRCSGGGTVLQMPGVLNFNLVLSIPEEGPLTTVTGTNAWVMSRVRDGIAQLPGMGGRVSIRGISDLCVEDRKCVGSAQRRKRAALVFHGSILIKARLEWLGEYLRAPSKQPDYREGRAHLDFCCNLDLPIEEVKEALTEVFEAHLRLAAPPLDRAERLVQERYGRSEWNRKF